MTDASSHTIHCTGTGCGHGEIPDTLEPTDGIGRRTFLIQSALVAAAAALAACGTTGGDISAPTLPTGTTIDVNSFSTLATVGGVAMVSVSGAQLAVVRTGSSSFVALSRICPHQGGTIQQSGSGFQCPVHGATFSATGQWIGGQRTSSMHSYATSYDAATGKLTIG